MRLGRVLGKSNDAVVGRAASARTVIRSPFPSVHSAAARFRVPKVRVRALTELVKAIHARLHVESLDVPVHARPAHKRAAKKKKRKR